MKNDDIESYLYEQECEVWIALLFGAVLGFIAGVICV